MRQCVIIVDQVGNRRVTRRRGQGSADVVVTRINSKSDDLFPVVAREHPVVPVW
jgi:hypothetical protein